ncbi:dynein light chain Tctex-type protein 2B isoform X1 [Chanodichthys erythropterus]|uniref:dynein light chain Tctex-type protein 2B isoform X1 n=1 Tax=Chanodichthys erythropterus TaxID=933992 RepID=UPI00351E9654
MDAGANTYLIRPNYKDKFKAGVAKECIREILREQLYGVQYNPEEVPTLSRSLADSIKNKLKDVGFDRYKLIVQVVVGEQRGEGVKMAARCFWDADTDSYVQDIYMNLVLCGCCIWCILLLKTNRRCAEDQIFCRGVFL